MVENPAFTIETYTASDGYSLRYRRYLLSDQKQPQAHVIAIHGIQSHGGWYESSCEQLSQAGFQVSFLDRRGAGLNERERGDAPSFRRLLDDLAEFIRSLRPAANGPPLPVFLLAISWGGKLAVALQRRHPGLVDGLVLICPGFCSQVRPTRRERLRIVWARLTDPVRRFAIPLDDAELFTANPRWLKFLRDDPLSLRQATARFLVESARLDGYLRFAAKHVRVPVLLLLAERDRIIDNRATRRFMERFRTADKEIIEYPGAHHTLEFEPDPDRFIGDVRHWLERQVAQGKLIQQVSG